MASTPTAEPRVRRPRRRGARPNRLALLLAALLGTALLAGPKTARAQGDEPLTLAFFAPNVYFSDSVARAGFISHVASQVADEVGVSVEGVNLSSPGGLDEADFAIIDGIVMADDSRGDPIGTAEGPEGRSGPLALIVGSSGPSRLSELAGRTLIVPRGNDRLVAFVTADVLHGEISAEAFFGDIEFTSNIESALSAVASGQADATISFAEYGSVSGLRVLSRHDEAPMPIVVQLNDDLDADLARRVADALRSASGQGSIAGFTSYDAGVVESFGRRSTRSREARTPLMTRPRSVTVEPGDVELPRDVEEPLVISRPIDLVILPTMEEQ